MMSSFIQKAREKARLRELELIAEEAKKKEEAEKANSEEVDDCSDDDEDILEIPIIEEEFKFYGKKWVLAPNMEKILDGNLNLIPIECLFTHYILRWGMICFYVSMENQETGDEFEIYEFEWVGEEVGEVHGEEINREPDFKLYEANMCAKDCAKFLAQKISEGYQIFIQKRKEFDEDGNEIVEEEEHDE